MFKKILFPSTVLILPIWLHSGLYSWQSNMAA
jgi:hypothetical protein